MATTPTFRFYGDEMLPMPPARVRDTAPPKSERHTHIWLTEDALAGAPGEAAPRPGATEMAVATRAIRPKRCSTAHCSASSQQDGQSGEWAGNLADESGENGEGTPLHIRSTGNGLEIYHSLPETEDAAPVGKLGMLNPQGAHQPPGSQRPAMPAPGLHPSEAREPRC
jgi:hypothetical protein